MKETTWKPILEIIAAKQPVRTVEILRASGLSEVRVHAVLKYLIEQGSIIKSGTPPVVYYEVKERERDTSKKFTSSQEHLLNDEYLFIDATGKRFEGVAGFMKRCQKAQVDPQKKIHDFTELIEFIANQRNACGLLSVYDSFAQKITNPQLDELFFMDVYQLLEFGKSKLASIAYFAKQTQSTKLMKEVIALTKGKIDCLQRSQSFDAVCYIPRSLPREKQLMTMLRYGRDIQLPLVPLKKTIRDIIVPQKSLRTTQERVRNARETLQVPSGAGVYHHILLVDDFVGSGGTMNEAARKLKENGIAQKITGLALVGNIDMSYDVIREM